MPFPLIWCLVYIPFLFHLHHIYICIYYIYLYIYNRVCVIAVSHSGLKMYSRCLSVILRQEEHNGGLNDERDSEHDQQIIRDN